MFSVKNVMRKSFQHSSPQTPIMHAHIVALTYLVAATMCSDAYSPVAFLLFFLPRLPPPLHLVLLLLLLLLLPISSRRLRRINVRMKRCAPRYMFC